MVIGDAVLHGKHVVGRLAFAEQQGSMALLIRIAAGGLLHCLLVEFHSGS